MGKGPAFGDSGVGRGVTEEDPRPHGKMKVDRVLSVAGSQLPGAEVS